MQTANELNPDFVYSQVLFGLVCIGYYEANELTPPADGIEILSGLGEVELDAVELDFLRNALGPDQPEQMLEVLAQLGLTDEDV